jgi:hypothetical protein
MTMHTRNIAPVSPVALDEVFETTRPPAVVPKAPVRRREVAAKALAQRPVPAPIHINGPSLVVVVPDKIDASLALAVKLASGAAPSSCGRSD